MTTRVPATTTSSSSSGSDTNFIIGVAAGVLGGLAVLIIIILIYVNIRDERTLRRQRKRRRLRNDQANARSSSGIAGYHQLSLSMSNDVSAGELVRAVPNNALFKAPPKGPMRKPSQFMQNKLSVKVPNRNSAEVESPTNAERRTSLPETLSENPDVPDMLRQRSLPHLPPPSRSISESSMELSTLAQQPPGSALGRRIPARPRRGTSEEEFASTDELAALTSRIREEVDEDLYHDPETADPMTEEDLIPAWSSDGPNAMGHEYDNRESMKKTIDKIVDQQYAGRSSPVFDNPPGEDKEMDGEKETGVVNSSEEACQQDVEISRETTGGAKAMSSQQDCADGRLEEVEHRTDEVVSDRIDPGDSSSQPTAESVAEIQALPNNHDESDGQSEVQQAAELSSEIQLPVNSNDVRDDNEQSQTAFEPELAASDQNHKIRQETELEQLGEEEMSDTTPLLAATSDGDGDDTNQRSLEETLPERAGRTDEEDQGAITQTSAEQASEQQERKKIPVVRRARAKGKNKESSADDAAHPEDDLYHLKRAQKVDKNALEQSAIIGMGAFGPVTTSTWKRSPNGADNISVAVKCLQRSASPLAKKQFLHEAELLARFKHRNIVRLLGVCDLESDDEETSIVLELMTKGSILIYLHTLQPMPGQYVQTNVPQQLLSFAINIAEGLVYLHEKNFTHCNLSGRIMLLDEKLVCKIGDFGLSLLMKEADYYIKDAGKLPVKWCPPEVLIHKHFSLASDIWSFGVVLYEIWSLARKPYFPWTALKVADEVCHGYRLHPPPGCPRELYAVMIDCWNPKPANRPKAKDVLNRIQGCSLILDKHEVVSLLGKNPMSSAGLYKDLQDKYRPQQQEEKDDDT